jgi:ABC-type lipoprotein export system ATPase subunit
MVSLSQIYSAWLVSQGAMPVDVLGRVAGTGLTAGPWGEAAITAARVATACVPGAAYLAVNRAASLGKRSLMRARLDSGELISRKLTKDAADAKLDLSPEAARELKQLGELDTTTSLPGVVMEAMANSARQTSETSALRAATLTAGLVIINWPALLLVPYVMWQHRRHERSLAAAEEASKTERAKANERSDFTAQYLDDLEGLLAVYGQQQQEAVGRTANDLTDEHVAAMAARIDKSNDREVATNNSAVNIATVLFPFLAPLSLPFAQFLLTSSYGSRLAVAGAGEVQSRTQLRGQFLTALRSHERLVERARTPDFGWTGTKEMRLQHGPLIVVENLRLPLADGSLSGPSSCKVAHNSFNVFMGANEAGKSRLVAAIGGLLTPTSGTIRYFEDHLTPVEIREYRRRSIAENVRFVGTDAPMFVQAFADIPRYEARRRVLLDLGVSERNATLAARNPDLILAPRGSLNIGERLSAGAADLIRYGLPLMLNDRPILILDEPGAHLDEAKLDKLGRMLREAAPVHE